MKQIKLNYWISTLLLPLTLLASCNVEEISRESGNPLPEGVTRLSATIRTGIATRAVGDLLGDATSNEKRVDRLAFFVHTDAEGMQVYEPAKTGETYDNFPNKVILKPVDAGDLSKGYTATVDLTTGAGYEADVIAVANLPEDYDYSQIVTWQGLIDSVTVGTFTDAMPLCTGQTAGKDNAFVMYGTTTVPLHKEKEETFALLLERLTARIDITNDAYVQGMTDIDPKGGFLLTEARILFARPQSYIVPQMEYVSPDVVTVSDWKAPANAIRLCTVDASGNATDVTDGDNTAKATATCQRLWHALYTYENHETDHSPTGIEIKGTFRGLPVTRQIPFEVTDADGIAKKAVPIVRNHRYLVQIKPAPGLSDITYSVTVGEWNAVDTINVQPNQDQVPVITNYTATNITKEFGTFDSTNGIPDTILISANTTGTISFKANCPFDTRVTVDYASNEDGNSWLEVTNRSEATVITKADKSLERTYEITIKANAALDATLVNRGYIYIANGGNGSIVDTVTVFQGTNIAYGDLRLAAITYKGSLWAPVNVGATEVPTSITSDMSASDIVKYCGYYFQWGRKTPFKSDGYPDDIAPESVHPTYVEAITPDYQYADKFITVKNESWFSDLSPLSPALFRGDYAWPRNQQPCPTGWQIPIQSELEGIRAEASVTSPLTNNGIWKSPSVPAFVLPVGGKRFTNGTVVKPVSNTLYWSSTIGALNWSISLSLKENNFIVEVNSQANGSFVRCVKE